MTSPLAQWTRRPRAVSSPPPPISPTSVALASHNYIRLNIHDCHSSCCFCNIHHAGNGSFGMQREVLGRSFSCNSFGNGADALPGLGEKYTHSLLTLSFTHSHSHPHTLTHVLCLLFMKGYRECCSDIYSEKRLWFQISERPHKSSVLTHTSIDTYATRANLERVCSLRSQLWRNEQTRTVRLIQPQGSENRPASARYVIRREIKKEKTP